MDKANAAEWILRRVVDPQRASELVGDQCETHFATGKLRFWLSIALLFFAFSSRTLVGIIVAVIAGVFSAIGTFFTASKMIVQLGHHLPTSSLFAAAMRYSGLSALLWFAAGFSLVRFGFRNELSQISVTAAVLCTATACALQLSYAPAILLCITAVLLLFYACGSRRRLALAILCAVVLLGWLTDRAVEWLTRVAFSHAHYHPAHHLLLTLMFLLLTVVIISSVEAATSLFLHSRLLDNSRNKIVE